MLLFTTKVEKAEKDAKILTLGRGTKNPLQNPLLLFIKYIILNLFSFF